MLELRRLRLLLELDRRKTMAEVARVVGLSPSAVSQQLGLLEEETGARLLESVGRGVRLTTRARILVEHTQAVIERLEQAEAELAAADEAVTGTLRVASFQSVLSTLVPPALAELGHLHPGLRVEMAERAPWEALEGLMAHDFDLVLEEELPGLPRPKDEAIDEAELTVDEIRLALPVRGPLADLPPTLEGAAMAPWAMDPPSSDFTRWSIARCREAGFEPDVRFETPDPLLQMRLVEAGQAVALLPDLIRRLGRAKLRLVRMKGRPARRLFTGARRGSAHHPAVRALREALARAAAASPRPPRRRVI